jgi:hypothetical protein
LQKPIYPKSLVWFVPGILLGAKNGKKFGTMLNIAVINAE